MKLKTGENIIGSIKMLTSELKVGDVLRYDGREYGCRLLLILDIKDTVACDRNDRNSDAFSITLLENNKIMKETSFLVDQWPGWERL